MPNPLTGFHLIDGTWRRSKGQFAATNPATGERLPTEFCEAGQEQVNAALAAARKAVREVDQLDSRWPAELLPAIAAEIMNLGDALLQQVQTETALPQARLISERARTVNQFKLFAELVRDGSWVDAVIDTADPNRQPVAKPDLRRMLRPRGPVVVFGASNFPLAFGVCGGDTASALAAGNPVIVKGHPAHPGTSELLAQAVAAALRSLKFPPGLFALLQGRSIELSQMLVRHPAAAAVGFTGSKKAGRALFDLAAARPSPIPVYAEMGSLNPLILLPGALQQRGPQIAKNLADSILLGGGQFCTKPGVILPIGEMGDFVQSLARHLSASPPITMLNQPLRNSFAARSEEISVAPGMAALARPQASGYASITPGLFRTTADNFIAQPALHEEAFGPAALIIHCADSSQAAAVLEAIGGSLTGTIHTGPGDDPKPLLKSLEPLVGRIVFDGYPTGVEVCPAMVHGGPYPATTDPGFTSVGPAAIRRFARMSAYQNVPDPLLPPALQNANPMRIMRQVNGRISSDAL